MRPVTQIGRWVDSETALSRSRCSLSILSHSRPGWTDLGFGKSQLRVWRPNFFSRHVFSFVHRKSKSSNTSLFTTRLWKQGFTYWQQSMFPQYKQHTILDMKHLAGWWRIQGKSVGSRWKQELSRLHRPDIREPAMKRKQPQALLCQFWHLAKFFPILISYLISWRIDLNHRYNSHLYHNHNSYLSPSYQQH